MRRSIYTHGMLLVGTFLTAFTIVITAWIAYDRNQNLTAGLKTDLDNLTKLEAAAVSDAVWNLNRDTAYEILAGAKIDRNFHSARVIMQNNKVFAEIPGLSMPATQLLTSTARIVVNEGGGERFLGYMEVTISLDRLDEQQSIIFWDTMKIGFIQLLAVLLGTGLVLRRIIGPVESIKDRLITLTEGETDPDIPCVERNDQIGDMARAVGTFRDSLMENKRLRIEEVAKEAELARARQEQIAEREYAEQEIQRLNKRNEMILNAAGEGICGVNLEGKITFINPSAAGVIGWEVDELIGKFQHDTIHHTKPDGSPYPYEESPVYATLTDGKTYNRNDELFWRKDGTSFPVEYVSTPTYEGNQLTGAVVVFHNITERVQTEEKIKTSLSEKEVLLQEIHHRVKNNLQVVSSLLSLQANAEIDGNIVNALKESERRVMVMARVHENLYKSDDIGHVDARGYLETIIDDLKESLVDRSRNVSFCTDFDNISFDIDQAIPVGQIVSELMSNTLKHAFPGDQGGEVKLSMKRLAGGRIKLAVTDNGIGLPGDFDPASVPTLGLKLVNALAGKLGAEVEMDGSEGTRFSIVFKGGLR